MNYMYLNRFFSRKYLIDMLSKEVFDAGLFNKELENNYKILNQHYRNEFFFKNTLFNKLVLGKYSVTTTSAFSEVVIGKSKADFVLINHSKGMVFEIKTDLDNLERLEHQLEDYYSAFSEVYVVTSEKNYYPVYKTLRGSNPSVGIIVLTDKGNLSVRKSAVENNSSLKYESLFKLLRKQEYEEILLAEFGCLPEVKPVQYFKTSLRWFKTLNLKDAQILVLNQLRKRKVVEDVKILKELPMSLRWIIYTGNFKPKEIRDIYNKLNQT
ncbi:sce7726 family protein [Bacillus mobilis]|nr:MULTISPECIES: sce7726 family protein [Bacillus cereus group]MED2034361.1 sce7726 family protein [Bacillus thuringiensis]MBG9831980.1 hypothetical protein [Bacillus wiedmannii]MED3077020.1 sce7726 family protein [Bacillus wiedmannii]PEO58143.1 hypothetical protein CN567_27105 [Bacillus toyonensis]PFX66810.1 hypothetical protein COL37_31235 [Bacillus toyonensis]